MYKSSANVAGDRDTGKYQEHTLQLRTVTLHFVDKYQFVIYRHQ